MIISRLTIRVLVWLIRYNTLLDALDSTYINPSIIEPRKAMVGPIINLISACHSDGLATQLIELTLSMLNALGFETEITATSFKMTRWGFMVDEVVVALADMCDGYAAVNPTLYDDVLEVAKTAYEIMCGERVSWDKTYGSDRRGKLGGTTWRIKAWVWDYAATRFQVGEY